MKKRSILLGLVISILLITNVSAGIYFSQPETYYNLGDVVEIDVSIEPVSEGFLKVDLVCDGGTVNVFNGVLNEEGSVNIKFPLTFAYIKENSGDCYFLAEYSESSQQSRGFEISKALDVRLDVDNLVSKPGEEIVVSGSAKRLNGLGINGGVEITIPLLKFMKSESYKSEDEENEEETENTEEESEEQNKEEIIESVDVGVFYGRIIDGVFSVNFKLKQETGAGDYRIDVLVYERDSLEKITSEGVAMANLLVLQVLQNIDIALDSQSVNPGENFNFKPMLMDQTGQSISNEVSVIIRDENLNRIFEQIIQSEETFQYQVFTNLTSGYYEIEASSNEINAVKTFYVNEKAIALFQMMNNTLVVTNIGNIPYKKDIQVELNGKPFVRKVDLDLGEKREFRLTGDGEFNVVVGDGETEITQEGVVLTGHAIDVEEVRKGIIAYTPIVWIFFIVILGAGFLFFFRNIFKKKSFAYPIKEKFKRIIHKEKGVSEINSRVQEQSQKPKKMSHAPLITPRQAEQVLVLKGHKNNAAILALKIKNKLTKTNKKELQKVVQEVHNKKGAIYEVENYLVAVFSPLMTRSFKNEITAAKVGESIRSILNQYNKKFMDKIDFGIGIGSGEIVNKIEGGKLKFTALGNFIPNIKRIAEASNEQVLMTKQAYEKAGLEIKAVKKGEIYEIRRVVDAEKNKAFIDGFLKRVGLEKDKRGAAGF